MHAVFARCRRATRLITLVVVLQGQLASMGCAHTPSPEDREAAVSSFNGAVALVHEARRAGAKGEGTEADLKWRQALSELLAGEKLDPENADVQYMLGMTYFVGFRRHAEAETHLRRAVTLRAKDGYPEAEYLLGTVLVDAGRPREAVPFLHKARGNLLYQTPYFAEQELGWAMFKLEDYDAASRHMKNAIKAQPDLCGAYVRLADIEDARGGHEAIESALTDFLERCDSDRLRDDVGPALIAYAWYRLGMSRLKLGNVDDARVAFETCEQKYAGIPVAKECGRALALAQ
jgi:type IV pilus assembly protein PilF